MAIRGVSLTITYTAWNTSTNSGQTLDAANHTVKLVRDGVESAPTNTSSEVDSTTFKGEYKLTLTAAEMTCDFIAIGGVSSTANVVIVPVKITTEHGVLPTVQQGNAGAVLTSGNGTGQLNVSGGKAPATLAPADVSGNLPANAVQIGGAVPGSATIGTVGTVTNAVTAGTVTDKSGYALSGAGVTAVQSGLATSANQTTINNNVLGVNTIVTAIQTVLSGITSLAQWLGALAGKQTANSTALAEIRATGAGSGTFDATVDSLEAIRNRGDVAWVTGGGSGTDPLTNASTSYVAGEIGYEIHWLYQRGNADEVIDTTSSPGWNIVYYVQGSTTELLRQRLLDISGSPVKLATTIVAQTKK